MFLHLHNWRCFSSQKFEIPSDSFIITDQNGSGKTSLLSAIYTLHTGLSWPGTKLTNHLQNGSEYFGISTDNPEWSFTGKVNPSGRISTRSSIADNFSCTIFTYIPTDNYIFSSARAQKLQFFDDLLSQQHGKKYNSLLLNLSKLVRSKQQIIKHHWETQKPVDLVLVHTLNVDILETSNAIWEMRKDFFTFLNSRLPLFSSWISSKLNSWRLDWETTDATGNRTKIRNYMLPYVSIDQLDQLFKRELAAGKILFGAHRDELFIKSNHIAAETSLSRGEMRLLILFIKDTARLQINKPSWFFLDDVFNEFDAEREKIVFNEVLSQFDFFIATGTRKPEFECKLTFLHDLQVK